MFSDQKNSIMMLFFGRCCRLNWCRDAPAFAEGKCKQQKNHTFYAASEKRTMDGPFSGMNDYNLK